MLAYLGVKYHSDLRNRPLIDELSRQFARARIDLVCVHREVEQWGAIVLSPEVLMDRTLRMIDGADAVILEMSEKGVGLGIEAGYARDIPVIADSNDPEPSTDPARS